MGQDQSQVQKQDRGLISSSDIDVATQRAHRSCNYKDKCSYPSVGNLESVGDIETILKALHTEPEGKYV